MTSFKLTNLGALAVALAVAVTLSAPADARRGGSFGSRGARTHAAPPPTAVAPQQTAPVQRTMTENRTGNQAARQPSQVRNAVPAKSGSLAKGLIGGLIMGGLIGALLGGGLGSLAGAGFLIALLQAALLGGLVFLLFRMFRRKPAFASHGGTMAMPFAGMEPRASSMPAAPGGATGAPWATAERNIELHDGDKQAFEQLLVEVQDAFGQEDYARLRERTTPEVMSYFAEELSQNATSGRRNNVTGTQLLAAEIAEAWREGSTDYATIAMHYESIDVMLDRNSGAVIEGDPTHPTQTTELWTFRREARGRWRLSAVQDA